MSDRRNIKRGLRQWECWRCKSETGVAISATTEVLLGPYIGPDGNVHKSMGTKIHACVYCLARGVVTEAQ